MDLHRIPLGPPVGFSLAGTLRFEGLAHSWLRLAENLERAEALVERLKAPDRQASESSTADNESVV